MNSIVLRLQVAGRRSQKKRPATGGAVRAQHTICEIFFLLFMGELRTIGLYYFTISMQRKRIGREEYETFEDSLQL